MRKIARTDPNVYEIVICTGIDYYTITIVDGEIVRVIIHDVHARKDSKYFVKRGLDLEFDDVMQVKHESMCRNVDGTIIHKDHEENVRYDWIVEEDADKFEARCCEILVDISNHALKELKGLYEHLKDGAIKQQCRKCQQEKLALLDF